jgi:hypothetical protein
MKGLKKQKNSFIFLGCTIYYLVESDTDPKAERGNQSPVRYCQRIGHESVNKWNF